MNRASTNSTAALEQRRQQRQEREFRRLKRRYRRDRRFKTYAVAALAMAALFLIAFLADLVRRGGSALRQTELLTKITYSESTVANPIDAFPPQLRDLVSHSRVREVSREGRRAEINLDVEYRESAASDPASAINAITLTQSDLPPYMQDAAPWQISRDQLLLMIDREALAQIGERINQHPSLAGTTQRQWLRGSPALQQFLMDSSGLDPQAKESAEMLDVADRLRLEFNQEKFGDGKEVEQWVLVKADVDQYVKGKYSEIGFRAEQYEAWMAAIGRTPVAEPDVAAVIEAFRNQSSQRGSQNQLKRIAVPDAELLQLYAQAWEMRQRIDELRRQGQIRLVFNRYIFINGDSKLAEAAGLKSAIVGSVYVLGLVFMICVPIGVLTSIYLEEFASDNWLTQIIEVNINNLAAIPSILFGVLGLAALINYFGIPRASVLVGGATLALMTLPIIIISARAALRSARFDP